MPILTLFCGLPGAGKTTLAKRLEQAGRGVRLCTDDWQGPLGVPHADTDFHDRLQRRLYDHAMTLLLTGCDVLLEDGLWMQRSGSGPSPMHAPPARKSTSTSSTCPWRSCGTA